MLRPEFGARWRDGSHTLSSNVSAEQGRLLCAVAWALAGAVRTSTADLAAELCTSWSPDQFAVLEIPLDRAGRPVLNARLVEGRKPGYAALLRAAALPQFRIGSLDGRESVNARAHSQMLVVDTPTTSELRYAELSTSEEYDAAPFRRILQFLSDDPGATLDDILAACFPPVVWLRVASDLLLPRLEQAVDSVAARCAVSIRVTSARLDEARAAPMPLDNVVRSVSLLLLASDPEPVGDYPDRLPNMMGVHHANENETRHTYQEIFVDEIYRRNGVRLPQSGHVIDVGANTGLFVKWVLDNTTGTHVHAFEPSRRAFRVLEKNTQSPRVTRMTAALWSSAGRQEFTDYVESSLQSGLLTNSILDERVAKEYAHQWLSDPREDLASSSDIFVGDFDRRDQYAVETDTLSGYLRDSRIDHVGLLKVDAERAEEQVLDGIADGDWAKICQLVVEVHDVGERLERLVRSLSGRGFRVSTEQSPLFADTELHLLYAHRGACGQCDAPGSGQDRAADRNGWLSSARHAIGAVSTGGTIVLLVPPMAGPSGSEASLVALRAVVDDGDVEVRRIPSDTFRYAPLSSAITDGLYPDSFVAALAHHLVRLTYERLVPPIKVVAVDADQTLWSGTVGETGVAGLSLSSRQRRFQNWLIEKRASGIHLVLCSTNERVDVLSALLRDDFPLDADDFVIVAADWRPKSERIIEICNELATAPESVMFLDDDPVQRAAVSSALGVVHVPALQVSADFPDMLRKSWNFSSSDLTDDDRRRADRLTDDKKRQMARSSTDFRSFLRDLEIDVEFVELHDPALVDRCCQLSVRTTQFNTSLTRLDPAAVRDLLHDGCTAFAVQVSDRFGDYGTVAFVAARSCGGVCTIEHFFLSCRALSRGIEWRTLSEVLRRAPVDVTAVEVPVAHGTRNAPARRFVQEVQTLQAHGGAAKLVEVDPVESAALGQEAGASVAQPLHQVSIRESASPIMAGRVDELCELSTAETVRAMYAAASHGSADATPEPAGSGLSASIVDWCHAALPGVTLHEDDNLRALGLDSILLLRVFRHAELTSGTSLDLARFLANPTIRLLVAQHQEGVGSVRGPDCDVDAQLSRTDEAVWATAGQCRVWAAERMAGSPGAQVIPAVYHFGTCPDEEALRRALISLAAQFPSLRLRLGATGDALQQHFDCPAPTLTVFGSDDAPNQDEFFTGSVGAGSPVLRVALKRLEQSGAELWLALHHAAGDGMSLAVVVRAMTEHFRRVSAEDSTWNRDEGWLSYSRSVHARRPSRGVASANRRARDPGMGAGREPWQRDIDGSHLERVERLQRRYGFSFFELFLCGAGISYALLRDRDEISCAMPVENRDPSSAESVGYFADIATLDMAWKGHDGLFDVVDETVTRARTMYVDRSRRVPAFLRPSTFDFRPNFDLVVTVQDRQAPLRLGDVAGAPTATDWWPTGFAFMYDVCRFPYTTREVVRSRAVDVDPGLFGYAVHRVLETLELIPGVSMRDLSRLISGQLA